MTIDRHIYFSNDEYIKIKEYADRNKLTFSKAVCKLCITALNDTSILNQISKLDKDINCIIKKQNLIYSLEEQIYSDMDFDNTTNPKKSKALNEFKKRMRNTYIND